MSGRDERYDLIVVGAGVNGAGIARDAALRGLRTLLLDKGDVGSGTTSWSTRLIHGGLRYLEHGEVGLVRESLRERERLLRIAAHLVEPLPLLIPVYAGDRRGPLLIRAGMVAYDALSFDKSLPGHRMLGRSEALQRAPGLAPDGLRGAALYYDAQVTFAERLAVENAVAAADHGAAVRLYTRVDEILTAAGGVAGVAATDVLTGETVAARAPVVVNVAGPWVDAVLSGGTGEARRLIGGTKGSHLVVGPFPGAPVDALYVEAARDGRPFFIIPWNGQYLIGTTDERYAGNLDEVVATDAEIDYLLEATNRVLPTARLARPDVLWTYAGVRPLPHQPAGATGAITRRHVLHDHGRHGGPRGLVSIVGGKLTTYRELAEQTVDAVGRLLDRTLPRSATATQPLPGARADGAFPGGTLQPRSADHLRRVYGAAAGAVVARAVSPELLRPFDPVSGAIGAEIPYAFEREGARTLADALLRRTMVGLGPEVGVGADAAAAEVARLALGWSEERAAREVAAYRAFIARYRPRSLAVESPAGAGAAAIGTSG